MNQAPLENTRSTWINGRRWDLMWLIGSAIVVPLGLVMVWLGVSSDMMNLLVTALVGGPHVFSTFLTSHLDPRIRRGHRGILVATAILVPAFVVAMTLMNFQILMSIFVFAASVHVLQQNAYLTDVYRKRGGRPESFRSRLIDYGVIGLSFYPIASYKLVHDEFMLGDIQVLIPSFVKTEFTVWAVSIAFTLFLGAWLVKTIAEYRQGALNVPKTLLIAVTTTIAFLVPAAAAGNRMELAFQTVNAWHSIQYLSITWLVLKARKERGVKDSRLLSSVSGPGRAAWAFYGLCIITTVALFSVIFGLYQFDPFRLSLIQYYYMAVFSFLFIHYALDGFFFVVANGSNASPDWIPLAAPASGR